MDVPAEAYQRTLTMRTACECGESQGRVAEVNGQDTVRCLGCGRFQYNAPRVETGREPRTTQTVHAAIKPQQRARIIERANGRCELCGKDGAACTASGLHVGHIISVVAGLANGLTEVELNSDENLICACDECNLGIGRHSLSLRAVLKIRMRRQP